METGEEDISAAIREVEEETGLGLDDLCLFENIKTDFNYQELYFHIH